MEISEKATDERAVRDAKITSKHKSRTKCADESAGCITIRADGMEAAMRESELREYRAPVAEMW